MTNDLGMLPWPLPGTAGWVQRWAKWTPRERATLMLVRRKGHLLLIEKKRGLGRGKVNAPGGRIEPGESAVEAAVRETVEEVHLRPVAPKFRGRLSFQFVDGFSIEAWVFVSDESEGEAVETAEARPFWVPLDDIPYARMWADDRLWLPQVLAGRTVYGYFLFDGDRMLMHDVQARPYTRSVATTGS